MYEPPERAEKTFNIIVLGAPTQIIGWGRG
jgi:hypothetical protein